ncbi:MAG: epoxide hydrolase, soluble (sEH) [Trichoglossum hirsutum]|nr:MAG: epoxide hydrolase, soluble (sEH) [Trichoglossum hirsutum]
MSQSSSDTSSYTPVQFLKTAFRIWCWPCGSPRDEEGTNESSTREESVGELRYDTLLPIFEPDPLQEPLLVRGTESEHAARWAFYTIIRNGGSIEEARRIAGHEDLVREVDFNLYGTRLATASSDQRIKVYNKEKESGKWKLCDTWRAHDAEVNCVKWISPFLGNGIGTVGEDGKFKIWLEDEQEATNSGRRFRCIYTTMSSSRVPYVSLSFTSHDISNLFVALVSRDGQLQVFEAAEPESLGSWVLVDQIQIAAPPAREEETSFKVQFDPSERPCYAAIRAGVEKDALSLVIASMDQCTVWRTGSDRRFYLAADLPGHRGLIRDVAWAPRTSRAADYIATAAKDGYIRIFKLGSPPAPTSAPSYYDLTLRSPISPNSPTQPRASSLRNAPSGIGAGLAGATRVNGASSYRDGSGGPGLGQVKATIETVAEIEDNHREVWRVKWSLTGAVLASGGDDGKIRMWRRSHYDSFIPAAEVATEADTSLFDDDEDEE